MAERSENGRIKEIFGPPHHPGARKLWLGLMLILIPFGIKHLCLDFSGTNVPTFLQYAKLQLSREADMEELDSENWELEDKIDEQRDKISELRGESHEYGRYGRETSAPMAFGVDEDYEEFERENRGKIQRAEEKLEELRKELDKQREAQRDERNEIRREYAGRIRQAQLDMAQSGASGIAWLQRGIWMKLLLDVPKILGCLIIIFATLAIVVDPEATSHLKVFSIVCSTITFMLCTVWSLVGYLI